MTTPPVANSPTAFRQQAERIADERAAQAAENLENLSAGELRQLVHEQRVRQIELELEIEGLNQTRASLVNGLLDSTADFVFHKDLNGIYLGCNAAIAAVIGLSKEDVVGKSDYELFDPETANRLRERDRRLVANGEPHRDEEWLTHADGSKVLVDTLKTPVRGPDGAIIGVLGIGRDITRIKRAEQQFQHQAARLNSLLDCIPDLVFFKDLEGVYQGCNPALARLLGRPVEEIIGKSDFDIFSPDEAAEFRAHDQCMLETCEPRRNQEWLAYPDGRRVLLDTLKTAYWGPDGTLVGVLGISRDITEFKQTQEDLSVVSDRLSLAVRAGGVGIWDYDVVANRMIWDDQMLSYYGTTREQFCGTVAAWHAGLHPADHDRAAAEVAAALRGERDFDTEFRVVWPDGSCHYLRAFATVQRDAAGSPLRMVGTNWDVTDQRLAEGEVQRQANLINQLLNSIPDTIYYKNPDGVYQLANPPFARDLGLPLASIVGKTDYDLFDREVADAFRVNDRAALAAGTALHVEEWVNQLEGDRVPFDTIKTPFYEADGRILGIIGISRNISGRKRTEQALQDSERSYRNQFENNTAVMLLIDPADGAIRDANHAAERFYGYPAGQLRSMRISDINPMDPAEISRAMANVDEVHGRQFQFQHRLANGALRDVEVLSSRILFGGRPILHTIVNDITARTRAESALRDSEANFRTFFETLSDMIAVVTPEGRVMFSNPALTRTLGHSEEALCGMNLLDLHPTGVRREAGEIMEAMFSGERDVCPLPLQARDGTLIPVETRIWRGKWDGQDCIFGVSKDLRAEQEATHQFEALFRSTPALIALVEAGSDRFLDVNDTFADTLGYTKGDILGKTPVELDLFPQPAQHLRAGEQLRLTGNFSDHEMEVRCRTGLIRSGLCSGELMMIQGRQCLLVVMIDITSRKRAEAELARISVIQRELMILATTFVNIPMGRQDEAIHQSLETMGRLIGADRSYLFSYDFTAEDTSNTHEWCADGIVAEIENLQQVPMDCFLDWTEAHLKGLPMMIPSVAAMSPDDPLRQILEPQGIRSLVTLPLMLDGACLGFVGFDAVRQERIWQDEEIALLRVLAELYVHFNARVAEERATRELQENLVTARDEAQAAAKAKGLFLANMSHEIRTPLNAILGYAQIMLLEDKDSPNSERLNAIARSGEHLLTLINDLLALVRSDARAITLAASDFDFCLLLEDVRLMFAWRLEARGVSLEISVAPDVPRFLHADQGKIRQILVNLVGNAFKFTHHGWVRMTATVLTGDDPDQWLLAVDIEDTGCGIGADELEAVFEVFGQSASGRKSGKGTGLGLHLSRRYAQALGGGLTVTSEPDRGSCFRVTFCAGVSSRSMVEEIHCGEVLRLAAGEAPCHLLVVDDDPANRDMLTMMLGAVGFTVEVADSAGAALQRLGQDTAVTVVLMDKRMPEMDGYEAIKRLRELPASTRLKVLVVTASGFAEERDLAMAVGADGFVAKPVLRDKLLAEIRRVSGVRYEYEAVRVPLTLPSTSLAAIPAALRSHFATALGKGDIRGMRDGLVEIAREHPELAAGLRGLVEAYDYVQLQSLLDTANHHPPAEIS